MGRGIAPAKAATDNAHPLPTLRQVAGERENQRRLATAAHGDIADYDHRNGEPCALQNAQPEREAPQGDEHSEKQACRIERQGHGIAPAPVACDELS